MKYPSLSGISISCSGPGTGTSKQGPVGRRRTREGADLKFTNADGAFFREHLYKGAENPHAERGYVHLVDPSADEIESAFGRVRDFLADAGNHEDSREVGVGIGYFGHGEPDTGAWVLPNGVFSATDLTELLCKYLPEKDFGRRSVDLFLDSCFSGAFLAEFLAAQSHPDYQGVHVYDAFAATMPDEEAWEIDDLGHGAFTYTLKNRGNGNYLQSDLARAVNNNEIQAIRKHLQCFVPNPVTFLTEGDQHSIDVDKYRIRVLGGGEVELPDRTFHSSELKSALNNCLNADDHETVAFPNVAG